MGGSGKLPLPCWLAGSEDLALLSLVEWEGGQEAHRKADGHGVWSGGVGAWALTSGT